MSAAVVPPRSLAGFTLLEVMVALVVGAITLSAAAALYLGLSSRADAIEAASRAVTRDANAERLLRLLAANAEPRKDGAAVAGDGEAVELGTWCETALGFSQPCRVRLAFHADRGGRELVLQRSDAGAREVVLRHGLHSGRFTYLADAAHGGSWAAAWSEPAPPPALGVVLDGDTLLLPVPR